MKCKPATIARWVAPTIAILWLLASPVQALSSQGEDCNGDVKVQTNPFHNRYDCTDCRGSVIVQVGTDNEVDCGGGECSGNVILQVGARNWVDCASGLLLHRETASAASAPPCPPPLPEGNFYCHVAARLLPREVCLSFDFCLW